MPQNARKLIPVSAGASTVTVTDFDWDDVHNIGTWTLSDDLDAGQYFVQLSKDLEDTDEHPLLNGWSNPVSIYDLHPGVSAAATDGSVNDDFNFAFTILPGDSAHDNDYGGHNFQYWPLAKIDGVRFLDSTDLTDGYLVPVGGTGTDQLRQYISIPLRADTVEIHFTQPMRQTGIYALGLDSLGVTLTSRGTAVVPDEFAWDSDTNTGSWHLQSLGEDDWANLIFGAYQLQLRGVLLDAFGHELDGEWTNPTLTVTGSIISGNNISGGTFVFNVVLLPGDIDNSHDVGFADLGILLNNYNQPGTFADGDLNGDGDVNFTDLGMLLNWYGFYL